MAGNKTLIRGERKMTTKIASVVWSYDSTQDPAFIVDGFASVNGEVKVDVSKELKTSEGASKATADVIEKIGKVLKV